MQYERGDHVWWGNPGCPLDGFVYAYTANLEKAFVGYRKPGERGKSHFEVIPVLQLRPFCRVCDSPLNVGQPCLKCSMGVLE